MTVPRTVNCCTEPRQMSKSDDKKLEALARRNAAKVAKAKSKRRRKFDDTLADEPEEDDGSQKLFSEMKKREF
jgi:hypothetical protein